MLNKQEGFRKTLYITMGGSVVCDRETITQGLERLITISTISREAYCRKASAAPIDYQSGWIQIHQGIVNPPLYSGKANHSYVMHEKNSTYQWL